MTLKKEKLDKLKSKSKSKLTANEAWNLLLDKYNIVETVEKSGFFHIKASEIKEFKEPRLMSKWDSSETLPDALSKVNLNILPNSRSSYLLSDFLLYFPIPDLTESIPTMHRVIPPELESIKLENITSESNAINLLVLTNILDDFLGVDNTVSTFNGRMGTGVFDFSVDTTRGNQNVHVTNAQCEIDGGFENDQAVIIMEAKNVLYTDFHIRQLYYPYRLWKEKVEKPIRLVFSIYTNQIFRLFEFKFTDPYNYSSIQLIQEKNYTLQDTEITMEELEQIRKETPIIYSDSMDSTSIPFIQADSFERVISLMENLYGLPKSEKEIAEEVMQFDPRQANYYYNAGRYLRLFTKVKDSDQMSKLICLSPLGKKIHKMNYKERNLKLVELIFQHKMFAICFDYIINNGDLPSKEFIKSKMNELEVCSDNLLNRRSSSVIGWLKWIVTLTKI
ncbi:MAG: type II restriction endonuclease [Tetragenococcus koreensis]|nr:type II restriction endonuclease [Tetragenococcus koreensis]